MSAHAHGFFNVISLQSEHQMPSDDLLKSLRSRTAVLLSCYGNDWAGKNASKKLSDIYGMVSIPLPKEVKDIAEYFQKYDSVDFQFLLDKGIQQSKLVSMHSINVPKVKERVNTKRGRIESYLNSKFNFRLNILTQQREISTKKNSHVWEKINIHELIDNLDRHGFSCSLGSVHLTV